MDRARVLLRLHRKLHILVVQLQAQQVVFVRPASSLEDYNELTKIQGEANVGSEKHHFSATNRVVASGEKTVAWQFARNQLRARAMGKKKRGTYIEPRGCSGTKMGQVKEGYDETNG